jgi:hypothetical protein
MGEIETTYDLPRNLTIITAVGKMDAADFREWTASYYAGTVTLHTLWDLTRADLSNIQADDLRNDAHHTKNLADLRKGGQDGHRIREFPRVRYEPDAGSIL